MAAQRVVDRFLDITLRLFLPVINEHVLLRAMTGSTHLAALRRALAGHTVARVDSIDHASGGSSNDHATG